MVQVGEHQIQLSSEFFGQVIDQKMNGNVAGVVRFMNKVVVITGGAHGIGRACAERFANEGANVVIADKDQTGLEETVAELKGRGVAAMGVVCDVSKKSHVVTLIGESVKRFGAVDILVSNAGIVRSAEFIDMTEEDWDDVINVNLKGVFLSGQEAAKQMIKQEQGGCIINMSSVNAVKALPTLAAYNASKGAINNLTRSMSLSLAKHNIRVNAVAPGSIMTEVLKKVAADKPTMDKVLSRTPMNRIGEPSEVASVVAFLASADASYMTGEIVYVDGGRMALNYTVPIPQS
eukprot:TRINITY_DN2116_c0_g1_i2.p1 TRINITY_DN2116_c0_g1~~TRINITY_DN2116_c0_g1_i2.p1  ORF type:complete len:291 (-),score=65.86 TRINITY_DN2116_c0_g1_i2:1082-1954(-)